jgi:hypothetical protein
VKLGLYGSDGVLLTTSERIGSQGTLTHFLEPGAYTLRVWSPDDDAASAATPYTLTLLD